MNNNNKKKKTTTGRIAAPRLLARVKGKERRKKKHERKVYPFAFFFLLNLPLFRFLLLPVENTMAVPWHAICSLKLILKMKQIQKEDGKRKDNNNKKKKKKGVIWFDLRQLLLLQHLLVRPSIRMGPVFLTYSSKPAEHLRHREDGQYHTIPHLI